MKKVSSLFAFILVFALAVVPASAAGTVVYDNIPEPAPGNVPSLGYEATSTAEFGSQVMLVGTERYNPVVTVLMSSWACESGSWYKGDCVTSDGAKFKHPITLNVYEVGMDNSVGTLLISKLEEFEMPYRPSADLVNCTEGRWLDGTDCYNGKAFPISFDLTGTTLPEKVIIGISYNTSHYGAAPLGDNTSCFGTPQGCPYDSLNVGTNPAPTVGASLPTSDDAYWNTLVGSWYCDAGDGGVGTFRLDAACWKDTLPAIRIEAYPIPVGPPTEKDQCKKDGWATFNNPTFKNQGDCISFIESSPKAKGNKK